MWNQNVTFSSGYQVENYLRWIGTVEVFRLIVPVVTFKLEKYSVKSILHINTL